MTSVTPTPSDLPVRYDDDPRVVHEQRTEDYARHVVPPTARVPRWKLTISFWSLLSAMVWLFYGALVASLVGTVQALIGLALTVVVYTAINWFMATWGTRTGMNSVILTRRIFGVLGSALTALLVAANTTYYTVFESSVLATSFHLQFGGLDIRIWYLIVIVGVLPLMLGAVQTWMDKINAYLLPFYVIGLVAAVVVAAVQHGGQSDWLAFSGVLPASARPVPGWLMSFVLLMGIWLMMPVTVDFARLGRATDLRFHRHVTFGWVFYLWLFVLNGLAGIFLVRTVLPAQPTAETGVVQAIVGTLGIGGVILILVTQTRINTTNYYLSSLSWERFFSRVFHVRLPRVAWVFIVAAAAFLLMLTDVFSYLQQALTWQGVLLVSWVGIVLTHFLLCPRDRKNGPEFRPGRLPAATPGLAVWIISAGIGIALTEMPTAFPVLSAVAPLVAFGISAVLYTVVLLVLPTTVRARPGDIRDDVTDLWGARVTCHVCDRAFVAIEMDRDPAADDAPICNACGEVSGSFLRAARASSLPTEPTAAGHRGQGGHEESMPT